MPCQWWYFCRSCGGEGSTKGEREPGVRGGIWRNWGDNDADDEATAWHSEGCVDGQWILCAEGASMYVSAWGVWDNGDQEKNKIDRNNAREMPLKHASETRRLGMFMIFGDMDGQNYKIKCMKEAGYVIKLFSTHGLLSKRCHKMSRTYKNRGETLTKRFCYSEPMDIHFCTTAR